MPCDRPKFDIMNFVWLPLKGDAPQQHGHFSGHGMSRAGGVAINNYNRSEGQNVRSLRHAQYTAG